MELTELPKQDLAIVTEFYELERQIKVANERQKLLRADLVDIMEDYGVKSWENNYFKVTYVPESWGRRFDSKKFQQEHPALYEDFEVESKRKASVRVTLK